MERDSLLKDRSFSSVIATSYRIHSDNIGRILKATWLPVLLLSISIAVMLAILLPRDGQLSTSLFETSIVLLLMVAVIGFAAWAISRVMSLLNEQPRKWNFMRCLFLILNIIVISLVLHAIMVSLLFLITKLTGGYSSDWIAEHIILCTIAYLVIVLLELPLCYVGMKYLSEPQMRFWKELWPCYLRGFKHFGFIFLTMLVAGIILCLLYTIVVLPITTLLIANTASFFGQIMGDEPDMPGYFVPLFIATAIITFFVAFYIDVFGIIVAYLMYGSIEKQISDKNTNIVSNDIIDDDTANQIESH